METQAAQTTLMSAAGVRSRELVAFVGAGGKTTALQQLVRELAADGERVLATTTTMMLAEQLSSLGPLLLEDEDAKPLVARAGEVFRAAGVAAFAGSLAAEGKVRGLAPATVDALWEAHAVDAIVVEADGSRGLPLKAFGSAEPQLPYSATTVVVLAGLDALGHRLDERHVHRAELLASALGVSLRTRVTPALMSAALSLQIAKVRDTSRKARVVVVLNKAESEKRAAEGLAVGEDLLAAATSGCGQSASGRPDRVVVASVRRGFYLSVAGGTA